MNSKEIISILEIKRQAIDKAVEALRAGFPEELPENNYHGPVEVPAAPKTSTASTTGGMSPEARRKLSLAMKKRWKAAKAANKTVLVKGAGA